MSKPNVIIGSKVRKETPSGWGKGVVVDVQPERQIAGHDGQQVVWADSTTHVAVTVEWVDGHESHGTDPGTRDTISVGHSFGGRAWPHGWTVTAPEAVA